MPPPPRRPAATTWWRVTPLLLLASAALPVAALPVAARPVAVRPGAAPSALAAGGGAPVRIVAAEAVYADVAAQIGGGHARVRAILTNPAADPHDVEASPAIAREIADAAIVIGNGIGYDSWLDRLLAASPAKARRVITVAGLLGSRDGDNPHLWYDPRALPALAGAVAAALIAADPSGAAAIVAARQTFLASLTPIHDRISALRARFAGVPVTATEPVFGDMAAAIGLSMRNAPFQLAVMNGTEPGPAEVARFEDDLRSHRVRLLIFNLQASDPAAARMVALARAQGIAVLGVSETLPAGMAVQDWFIGALDRLGAALQRAPS